MKSKQLAIRDQIVDLTHPNEALELANTLTKIILTKGLSIQLNRNSDKRYVMVEGWQLAGALCGIYPIVEKVENLSDDKRICYRAEVTLRNQYNKVVGTGMAICTNQEKGKERFGEYAICSMAQTRAVGKALRLKLGWIIKLAGFQPTPSEELDSNGEAIDEEFNAVEAEAEPVDYSETLSKAKDVHELYELWLKIPKKEQANYADLKDGLKAKLLDKNGRSSTAKETRVKNESR